MVSFLGGFCTALFAEPIRRWIYQPKLSMEFGDTSHFLTRTPETTGEASYEAIYVRVKIVNTKATLAKSCRAYLVNIEQKNPSGNYEPTEYCESLQLGWAVHAKPYIGIDLATDVPFFVDIFSTRSSSPAFKPQVELIPMRYNELFSTAGVYRLTVLVSGDGVKPARMYLELKWSADWENFDVTSVGATV
jgi:hypothetical protein